MLQCRPLEAFWNLEMQALPGTKCVDTILFFLGNSIANCFIDLATLTLPIREITKLHTSRSKKIGIALYFPPRQHVGTPIVAVQVCFLLNNGS